MEEDNPLLSKFSQIKKKSINYFEASEAQNSTS